MCQLKSSAQADARRTRKQSGKRNMTCFFLSSLSLQVLNTYNSHCTSISNDDKRVRRRRKVSFLPMKSIKKSFYIPPSYTFTIGCSNPSGIVSVAPFVSSCSSPLNYVRGFRANYRQRKSQSISTVAIHDFDDESYKTAPSTFEDEENFSRQNPFEQLAQEQKLKVFSFFSLSLSQIFR